MRVSLKFANKQSKTVQNDYEMTLNEYSEVEEAGSEEMFITETKFNFVPIDELLVRVVSYVELLWSLNTVFRMIISYLNGDYFIFRCHRCCPKCFSYHEH